MTKLPPIKVSIVYPTKPEFSLYLELDPRLSPPEVVEEIKAQTWNLTKKKFEENFFKHKDKIDGNNPTRTLGNPGVAGSQGRSN